MKVSGQSNDFVLNVEKHWDTYGAGGTCISGTHNSAISDFDNDGLSEIATGGYSYGMVDGNRTSLGGPLRIWSWNGEDLTLEKSENWPGSITCVYAGDADQDGRIEIITAGSVVNGSRIVSAVRFWNWNGQNLTLRGSYEGISVSSVFVGDIDSDGSPETVGVGRAYNTSQLAAQLSVWNWDGISFNLKATAQWHPDNEIARASSVSAGDLNGDGAVEIATCGYTGNVTDSSGELRVWQSNGNTLSLQASQEWRKVDGYSVDMAGNVMGNTMAYNIKIGDVDGDGSSEILTGGFTYTGSSVEGQLRIWNWTGASLNLEKSQEWSTKDITELKSISINDVDADGKTEIVTSGVTTGYGSWSINTENGAQAQLRVWSWNGQSLTLKQSTDWVVGDGVCAWNDGSADLAGNGKIEIMTVGCMYSGNLCDPDMRIWSLPTSGSTPTSEPSKAADTPWYLSWYFLIAVIGILIVVLGFQVYSSLKRVHE